MMRTTTRPVLRRRGCVEVERKFRYEAVFVNRLKANSGSPAFRSLEYLGQSTFTDTYFDDPVSTLSTQGVWIRRRGGTGWQAKIRQGGDYTNSQFQELSCPDDIGRLIKSYNIQSYSPKLSSSSSSSTTTGGGSSEGWSEGWSDRDKTFFGLKSMAEFTTIREAWRANKKFKIVLDKTDFGHAVGEVELELEVEEEEEESIFYNNNNNNNNNNNKKNNNSNNNNHYDDNEKKLWGGGAERHGGMMMMTTTQQMDLQIETFMQDYSWAFPDGKVVGKLSAYFEFVKRNN